MKKETSDWRLKMCLTSWLWLKMTKTRLTAYPPISPSWWHSLSLLTYLSTSVRGDWFQLKFPENVCYQKGQEIYTKNLFYVIVWANSVEAQKVIETYRRRNGRKSISRRQSRWMNVWGWWVAPCFWNNKPVPRDFLFNRISLKLKCTAICADCVINWIIVLGFISD